MYVCMYVCMFVYLLTEIDDSDSGRMRSDHKRVNNGLDKVKNQLPVVDVVTLVVTNAGRVVDQKRNVSNTDCNQIIIIISLSTGTDLSSKQNAVTEKKQKDVIMEIGSNIFFSYAGSKFFI